MASFTTLCYIEKEEKYLMLHRVSKKKDVNKEKWIGVGGHFEEGESPEECLLREVKEETGYTLQSWKFRGLVTFVYGKTITEYMALYTADAFSGELISCDEGELEWISKKEVKNLNIWEGDKIFLRLIEENRPFFSLKLVYDETDTLKYAALDGKTLPGYEPPQENRRIVHEFAPVFDQHSKVLVLGTFPSVKSREQGFYYGHPQNRFWKIMAFLTDSALPQTIEEKKALLLEHGIAVWDVVAECEITGSSDSSIRNVVPAKLEEILSRCEIRHIYANGQTAKKLYEKYSQKKTGREIISLPSTSPANAAYSLERLQKAWGVIKEDLYKRQS